MQPDELLRAAEARARTMVAPRAPEAQERLRTDVLALLARLPEPPLYLRSEDPARRAAQALLPEVEELLARALAHARLPAGAGGVGPLLDALRAHAEALCHTVDGRLVQAEEAWGRGRAREREASRTRQLLERGRAGPAYERESGRSRYDARVEAPVQVKLVCPNTECRRVEEYPLDVGRATQRFVCRACSAPFEAFFGEVRQVETEEGRGGRRWRFDVEELGGGGGARVEFDEASGADFGAGRGDLMAFLYPRARELKVVVDLTSLRFLWVSPARACFVATVAFGEGAPELEALRAWRDGVLRKRWLGRLFIRGYYRLGPGLAAALEGRPRARRWVRAVLVQLHRRLARGGRA